MSAVIAGVGTLRSGTADLHEAAEQLLELPASLRNRADVAGFLERWRTLASVLEPHTDPTLCPSLLPAIDADLRVLADQTTDAAAPAAMAVAAAPAAMAVAAAPAAMAVAAAPAAMAVAAGEPRCDVASPSLGVAWVLLGARLGLRSLQPAVQHIVDPLRAGGPLAVFGSVDADALIAVRRRIDPLDGDELAAVVADARQAFAVSTAVLGGPPWS